LQEGGLLSTTQPPAESAAVQSTVETPKRGKGRRVIGKGKRLKSIGFSAAAAAARSQEESAPRKRRSGSASSAASKGSQKKAKTASKGKSAAGSEDGESISLVASMTTEQINKHLESLNKRIVLSARTVTYKCRPVLQELLDDQFGWVFKDAVDPVALNLPDYPDVVKHPMHLELVQNRLENAIYPNMESFAKDTRLVFENAILYNGEGSEVGELAQTMLDKFEKSYSDLVQGKNFLAVLL
jgi:hypothetical protein